MLRIIGIGSPFVEDALGLQAVELLRERASLSLLPLKPEFMALDRPGSGLIEAMRGAGAVVLIDAMRSEHAVAEVVRLMPDELGRQDAHPSSHGFGVAETLALAEVLGELPPRLFIYGIEAGDGADPADWYPKLAAMLLRDLALLTGSRV